MRLPTFEPGFYGLSFGKALIFMIVVTCLCWLTAAVSKTRWISIFIAAVFSVLGLRYDRSCAFIGHGFDCVDFVEGFTMFFMPLAACVSAVHKRRLIKQCWWFGLVLLVPLHISTVQSHFCGIKGFVDMKLEWLSQPGVVVLTLLVLVRLALAIFLGKSRSVSLGVRILVLVDALALFFQGSRFYLFMLSPRRNQASGELIFCSVLLFSQALIAAFALFSATRQRKEPVAQGNSFNPTGSPA